MKPKLIKTEADYEAALERIDEIFDARSGTPEGDELELLATLVEDYEEQEFPVSLPDPLTAIRFRMDQQDLKPKDLVPFIGSPSKVSEVLSGQRNLSLTMIRNLVDGLDIPADVLVQAPRSQSSSPMLPKEWRLLPIPEMVRRGWFTGFRGTATAARKKIDSLISDFLGPLGEAALRPALNRQRVRTNKNPDPWALAAWRIRVVNLALEKEAVEYSEKNLTADCLNELSRLSALSAGPKLAEEYLSKIGIRLVVERHLQRTYLDGAAILLPDGSPVVGLTLRYDRQDHFWFTLFHELAHVSLHLNRESDEAFFDDMADPDGDSVEKEADRFACDSLIPPDKWEEAGLVAEETKPKDIREFAAQLRIHPAIVAGRVQHEKKDYSLFRSLLGSGTVRECFETE